MDAGTRELSACRCARLAANAAGVADLLIITPQDKAKRYLDISGLGNIRDHLAGAEIVQNQDREKPAKARGKVEMVAKEPAQPREIHGRGAQN